MSRRQDDDHLAYGGYHGNNSEGEEGGDRGLIGDIYHRFRGRRQDPVLPQHESVTNAYQPHLAQQQPFIQQPYQNPDQSAYPKPQQSTMSFLFDKVHAAIHDVGRDVAQKFSASGETHGHTHNSGQCSEGTHADVSHNRFDSFAPQREGNDIKWFVDGCGYMWAVSRAIENARESIWILDWWLSPELYLRRPPARHEQYRIDRMLKAAAERGVKVNIIVYKEVTQALTRKYLNPTVPDYLHSLLPQSTDPFTRFLTRVGLDYTFKSLEVVEEDNPLIAPPVTVSSSHTKHALEDLHQNISVFRHPDHLPDRATIGSEFLQSFRGKKVTAANAASLPLDAFKAIYGTSADTVLYWAHHEKLCLVDGRIAFMGGLDLCYGRWDTNQHPIADAHPGDLNDIVFPGQDFNNARIMDFSDVTNWQNNKLDRTTSSRMGWSDISLCFSGPAVEDLRRHFVQRWNFIYDEKYHAKDAGRYGRLSIGQGFGSEGPPQQQQGYDSYGQGQGQGGEPYYRREGEYDGGRNRGEYEGERGFGGTDYDDDRFEGGRGGGREGGFRDRIRDRIDERRERFEEETGVEFGHHRRHQREREPQMSSTGNVQLQLTRSCAKWSHGVAVEHSIANAYIETIRNSQHFVYIENQFFITATSEAQKPVRNMIGAAIVERIVRAARNGENYKMFVMMPSVPAFAGDLKADDALGTRAIMEFQYRAINRGHGHSIYEQIAKQGVDPLQYIRFYNLRNYDRINSSAAMAQVEAQSGVTYQEASHQFDTRIDPHSSADPYRPYGSETSDHYDPGRTIGYGEDDRLGGGYNQGDSYQQYQRQAKQVGRMGGLGSGRWDSVSECYMLGGEDIRNVPWEGGNIDEIDAFVSEELYIHSKLLIADDRTVICGSANLNDRSQLGDHDSEIAIVIDDPTPVDSYMGGQPWRASKFAASLRRQIFRKHLGLIRPQDMERPDQNFEPIGVPNIYDWGSREDEMVIDPLDPRFTDLWYTTAKRNTDAFARIFHPVPYDGVRTWKQYDDWYEQYFKAPEGDKNDKEKKESKYKVGHVVREEFAAGPEGVMQVKDILSTVRGTLVEMPLLFLKDEDMAKEGLGLNAFTEEVYT